MGVLFLASGGSTGMAAVALIMFLSGRSMGESRHKIEVADRVSMLVELLVLAIFLGMLGSAAQPITSGRLGPLFWGGLVGAGLIGPLLLNFFGRRMPALRAGPAGLPPPRGFHPPPLVRLSVPGAARAGSRVLAAIAGAVVRNGGGREVLITVFQEPEMTDAQYREDLGRVRHDLEGLKRVLEGTG